MHEFLPAHHHQIFVRLWNLRYPSHSWDATARTTRSTRDHATGGIVEEEVLVSGLMCLEGTWMELPLIATHLANENVAFAHTDGRPVKLFGDGYFKEHGKVRLVGVDGIVEAEGTVNGRAKKDPDDHVLRKSTLPANGAPADCSGLRAFVPDPAGVPASRGPSRPNATTRRKMLVDGVESFGMMSIWAFAVGDKAHNLLEHAHPALVLLFKDVKNVRNNWASCNGSIDASQYRKSCSKIQNWADECAKAGLLEPADAALVASAIKQLDDKSFIDDAPQLEMDRRMTEAAGQFSGHVPQLSCMLDQEPRPVRLIKVLKMEDWPFDSDPVVPPSELWTDSDSNLVSAQTTLYGVGIAAELGDVFTKFTANAFLRTVPVADLSSIWAGSVAVITPVLPDEQLCLDLRAATIKACTDAGLPAAVATALERSTNRPTPGALYFGTANNVTGPDRPYVLLTGFQHPSYLRACEGTPKRSTTPTWRRPRPAALSSCRLSTEMPPCLERTVKTGTRRAPSQRFTGHGRCKAPRSSFGGQHPAKL